ncbi:MAG: TIR domain-containing protein [Planctomycetota bacterium]
MQLIDELGSELPSKNRSSPEFKKWKRDTEVAITKVFGSETRHIGDFGRIYFFPTRVAPCWSPAEHRDAFLKGLENARALLQSFIQEIEDYWAEESGEETKELPAQFGSDVFIVHGHDDAAKERVARFIERLGLKAIVLHEQPDKGRTVIEKFEDHSNVGFAVVLLTPDDIGGPINDKDKQRPRARQNVIFELGFFIGKLGRDRVCALYKGDVEIPSDYKGVLYKPMKGDWQLSLAKEIQAAGIPVDLNKAM